MKIKFSSGTKAFLILVLIVLVIIGITRYNNIREQKQYEEDNFLTYNHFEFERIADMWWTKWISGNTEYTIPFRYNPEQTENVTINGEIYEFSLDPLYITFNPEDTDLQYVALAASELSISLAKIFKIIPTSACTEEFEGVCPPKEIITCTNTNESVFLLQKSNVTSITAVDNCIIFQGSGFELVRAVDRFLFMLYGIM